MPNINLLFLLGAVATAATAFGCSTKCGAVACADQFHATLLSTDDGIPSGTNTLEVTADGVMSSCTLEVPPAAQFGAETIAGQCPTGLGVFAARGSFCGQTGAAPNCATDPARFFVDLSLNGRPAQLRVQLTVGGILVLDRAATPSYRSFEPNGSGCPPVCQNASVLWTFSPP